MKYQYRIQEVVVYSDYRVKYYTVYAPRFRNWWPFWRSLPHAQNTYEDRGDAEKALKRHHENELARNRGPVVHAWHPDTQQDLHDQ